MSLSQPFYARTLWHIDHTGVTLELISPLEFRSLPDGTELVCIDGSRKVKGRDEIDQDTRMGYLAYGFVVKEG